VRPHLPEHDVGRCNVGVLRHAQQREISILAVLTSMRESPTSTPSMPGEPDFLKDKYCAVTRDDFAPAQTFQNGGRETWLLAGARFGL